MEPVTLENRQLPYEKNTDKDQLSGNHKAGQRLCVCFVDSFLNYEILRSIYYIIQSGNVAPGLETDFCVAFHGYSKEIFFHG